MAGVGMMYHNIMKIQLENANNGILYLELWHKRPWLMEPILRCAIPWGLIQFDFFTLHGKMEHRGLS